MDFKKQRIYKPCRTCTLCNKSEIEEYVLFYSEISDFITILEWLALKKRVSNLILLAISMALRDGHLTFGCAKMIGIWNINRFK